MWSAAPHKLPIHIFTVPLISKVNSNFCKMDLIYCSTLKLTCLRLLTLLLRESHSLKFTKQCPSSVISVDQSLSYQLLVDTIGKTLDIYEHVKLKTGLSASE